MLSKWLRLGANSFNQHPFVFACLGTSLTISPGFYFYQRYKSKFDERHPYLSQIVGIINDQQIQETITPHLGSPINITNYRSGKINKTIGFGRSKIKISGPLGNAYLHTSARKIPQNLDFKDTEDEKRYNEEVSFSDIWEYPYLIKFQLIKFAQFIVDTFSSTKQAKNIPLSDEKKENWEIESCFVVIPPPKLANFWNFLSKFNLFSDTKLDKTYDIIDIIGQHVDNPDFYHYIHSDSPKKQERAKKALPVILSCFIGAITFLIGRQMNINRQRSHSIKIINHFVNNDNRLTSKFDGLKILDIKGEQKNLFMDVEVSIIGKLDDIGQMRFKAHRYSLKDPFNVYSAMISINQGNWLNLVKKQQSIIIS